MAHATRRAAPLAPQERRAAIIAATIPLLRVHGKSVTTAQIAFAAGVAEGTLFRAFLDKESLIQAAIQAACDPTPTVAALEAIPAALPARARLIAAVEILQARVNAVFQLIMAMGLVPPRDNQPPSPGTEEINAALAGLLEAIRGELRCEPAQAARVLRLVTFAGSHPRITEGPPFTAGEIVGIVLDGIRLRSEEDDAC